MVDRRLWVYVHCPHCNRMMQRPFARLRVAVTDSHGARYGQACRVVVVPDPVGDDHQVHLVPEQMSFEEMMQQVLMKLVPV